MKASATRGLVAIVLVLLASVACARSLDFTITYREARGLRPEQPIVYKGLVVGKVRAVDLEPGGTVLVRCRIDPQYRAALYREARFSIEKTGGFLDTSGDRQIVVTDAGSVRTPLQPDDVLAGSEGFLDHLLGAAPGAGDRAGRALAGAMAQAQAWAASPEADRLRKDLQRFAAESASLARSEYERFRSQQWPEIEKQLQRAVGELERLGRGEDARALRERIRTLFCQ